MTRARDVADTQDNTGGAVAPFLAGKNFLINGGFDFFQRGSLSTTSGGYGLDRWYQESSGSGSAVSITQQTTGVPSGSRYCGRITTGASAGYGNQTQIIETANVAAMWGRTVTLSIKLRRSAAFAGTLSVVLSKSATVDAGLGAAWTAIGSATATNAQLPTGTTSADWYTLSFSTAVPNDGTANGLRLAIQQSQVETSAYWEMAQAQLEIGSVATPFSRAGGTIQGELAACQRYYFRTQTGTGIPYMGVTVAGSATTTYPNIIMKQTMRTSPTSVDFSGLRWQAINNSGNITTAAISDATPENVVLICTTTGATTAQMNYLIGQTSAAYVGFSAEL